MKFCLDAGHGGRDHGAIGAVLFTLEEKSINLSIANFLEEQLEKSIHWVAMTRRRDVYVALEDRAAIANQLGADYFISIHTNSFASQNVSGIEVFHYPEAKKGKALAEKIMASLAANFSNHNIRGVKARNLKVLKETNMPAVLVEVEFLSNPEQLIFLAEEGNRESLAEAIAQGIENYITTI